MSGYKSSGWSRPLRLKRSVKHQSGIGADMSRSAEEEAVAAGLPPDYSAKLKANRSTSENLVNFCYDHIFETTEICSHDPKGKLGWLFCPVTWCEVFCATVACTLCSVLMAPLLIIMIIIGAVYFDDCPGRSEIPIWLIVFGCVGFVQTLIQISKQILIKSLTSMAKQNQLQKGVECRLYARRGCYGIEVLLSVFLLAWLIVGSVWVFGYYDMYRSSNDACSGDYCCHPVPYLFSFATLITMYVGPILMCCIGSLLTCVAFNIQAPFRC